VNAVGSGAQGLQLREVVIGCNSKVWRAVVANERIARSFAIALSHRQVGEFPFAPGDRVWVFSYSRVPRENAELLAVLEAARVREVVYVSTATTIVTRLTKCYEYPRVKQLAEEQARGRLSARILTLGLVVTHVGELPSGHNAMTLQSAIEEFMLAPHWPHDGGARMNLFDMVAVPFGTAWEAGLYRVYDRLQWALRHWPCILRPFDLVLRAVGIRWYGYVNLSNRLWTTTTS
jgi:hypothetical protein